MALYEDEASEVSVSLIYSTKARSISKKTCAVDKSSHVWERPRKEQTFLINSFRAAPRPLPPPAYRHGLGSLPNLSRPSGSSQRKKMEYSTGHPSTAPYQLQCANLQNYQTEAQPHKDHSVLIASSRGVMPTLDHSSTLTSLKTDPECMPLLCNPPCRVCRP